MAEHLEQSELPNSSLIAGSDATFDYVCQPCNGEDKTLEAVGFCVDCSEFLCDECFKYHKKPTITRHHQLVDIETAKNDTSLSGCLDICTEKCSQHSGKTIEYFCADHDYPGCGICITLGHTNCKGVQYIPKIAKDIGKRRECSNLIRQLGMVLLQTKVLADKSLGNKVHAQDTFDKAIYQVKQLRTDVNEALRILDKEMEKEAKLMKRESIQKMDGNVKACDKIRSKAENLTVNMETMLKNGQYCNLFIAMKTNRTELQSILKSLEDISSDNFVSDYQFHPDQQLANLVKHIGKHGTLCKKDGINTKARKVGKISADIDGDSRTCCITELVMIPSERLVAADYNNKKVKLIDIKQAAVVSEFRPSWYPCDITTAEEGNEIAVTQGKQHEIVLLTVRDDTLYEDKKIKTTGPCYGIASIKEKFVVNLKRPERLEIIDKQGNVLHTIAKDEEGAQLFSYVLSVAVSQDTGIIYVSDREKDMVIKLSLSGTMIGIYKDKDLKGPCHVAVGRGSAVYVVCDNCSGNIYQITSSTSHCDKIRVLLTKRDGLDMPVSMCYDGNTDRLYVGQGNNNTILIYQLS